MISTFFKRFTGSHYRRYLRKCQPLVARINDLDEQFKGLTDEQLREKTQHLRGRYRDDLALYLKGLGREATGQELVAANQRILDGLLPEAFAVVKNGARRLCGQVHDVCGQPLEWQMVHYDVQLIGGMSLHDNRIAEMATGEGKTLVATLPLYLNALSGRNCQLVTVNDYLARRDSEWMGYLFRFLGLTVGCIQNWMGPVERRQAYGSDITYGTASEFGFDYLRDNGMALRKDDQVQRDHYYVIIDEVDSILVDEARTPLIISGPASNEREAPYMQTKPIVEHLMKTQTGLCNRMVSEAKTEFEKGEEGDIEAALEKLLLVKQGAPKNKQLLRLLEQGEVRKQFEKFELEMHSDYNKERAYRLKEQLFFVLDEKQQQADLTEKGRDLLKPGEPNAYVLPDLPTIYVEIDRADAPREVKDRKKAEAQAHFEKVGEEIHTISQLLRAYSLFEQDVQYVVQDGKVLIVDENTGRIMPGRRWSDGLHQAVEAKEGVNIERETKTYATITIQNYFRLYEKLAGMTGTAETEANEFKDIYGLDVMVIPTHRPNQRVDANDIVYKTRREKYQAVIDTIKDSHQRGQPLLVGTASVEASEVVSRLLRREAIPHTVLNAKMHQQEAEIVARAGQRGAVTIATNMAGRGTDIKLGPGVPEVGGLFVLGTERHQSRRIDRQLRGRCARQGDPGFSRFFLSLEDDLMRLYSKSGWASVLLDKSFVEGEPLESRLLNPAIGRAQKTVEELHYSARKRLLQYDDVLNRQREVVYGIRNGALHSEDPKQLVFELIDEAIDDQLEAEGLETDRVADKDTAERLAGWMMVHFPLVVKPEEIAGRGGDTLMNDLKKRVREAYEMKEAVELPQAIRQLERFVIVTSIDRSWQDHLTEMEELRQSVGLRSYGQKDPLQEYKKEAFTYFEQMMVNIRAEIARAAFSYTTNVQAVENLRASLARRAQATGPGDSGETLARPAMGGGPARVQGRGVLPGQGGPTVRSSVTIAGGPPGPPSGDGSEIVLPKVTIAKKPVASVGRNDPCPCGSGKKYKKCCGAKE